MKYNLYIFLLLFCFFCSAGNSNAIRSQSILNKDTIFNLSADVNDSISIHYIGCTGFFIRKGNDVVLMDPYFSYKKPGTYLFGKLTGITTISAELKRLINSIFRDVIQDSIDHSGLIKTLLITHAHVDHYGDVPYLFQSNRFNLDTIKVIASTNTQYYLNGDNVPDKNIIKPVEFSASSVSAEGKWINVNSRIRVLPIISEHAPHLKKLGLDIYVVPEKNKKKKVRHKYWRQYATGQTLCYLIDFLNQDGDINFRIYLNGSASNYPFGFPAQSILDQHPVDIATLCVGSFDNVKNYPEGIIKYLKPKHIITSHWEDFLNYSIPELKKNPENVPANDVNKFFKRLDAVLSDLKSQTTYIRPNVNTTIDYFYSNTKRR